MRFFILCTVCATIALSGCKKKNAPMAVTKPSDPEPAPAPIDDRNSAPIAGGGAIQNVRQAAKRTVALSDMHQLGIMILQYDLDNNKLPTVSEIKAMLTGDGASIRKQIDEGTIILTGTKDKAGLWAYEVDADRAGGIVLTGPSANARRASADEVKALLGK
ncbi:hypothetical protein [Limnoglobus roseus]|uniref:Lipoprotein n=1 Tax=Limnoglobus roseus TaxID=2598579 RepID=A0A5C1ACJ5_9BACT|nr:hypothetical protein [Limnoglobus roseus]QEL17021.1 hypothetical protein PX52LOC_03997 [Limnoglobus roseus]